MKIVFFNGPPGCGKDTAVSHLVPYLNFTHLKFAAPIKRMVCGLLNEDTRWLEANKDIPHKALQLQTGSALATYDTARALLIALSEDLLKQRYGTDFFGRIMNNEISKSASKLVLISDSGFASEAIPVIKKWGTSNCLKIEIHRGGHTFENDSRSYWMLANTYRKVVRNDAAVHDLTMRCLYAIIKQFPEQELLKQPEWIK